MKEKLLKIIKESLKKDYQSITEIVNDYVKDAQGMEGRNASRYDTMRIETSWTAASQSARAKKLEHEIKLADIYNPINTTIIKNGSLVEINNDDKKNYYFILPFAGGKSIEYQGNKITVLNLQAPLAKEIIEHKKGDTITLNNRQHYICNVQ